MERDPLASAAAPTRAGAAQKDHITSARHTRRRCPDGPARRPTAPVANEHPAMMHLVQHQQSSSSLREVSMLLAQSENEWLCCQQT
jgi:cytochrome c1